MSRVVALTDDSFEAAVGRSEVALLDFWSESCKPCKALAPVVEALAEDFAEERRVLIGKVNVEESPAAAERFRIRGLPAVLILKNGEIVKKFLGVQPKETLRGALLELLA